MRPTSRHLPRIPSRVTALPILMGALLVLLVLASVGGALAPLRGSQIAHAAALTSDTSDTTTLASTAQSLQPLQPLHVQGNHLVDATGQTVRLYGVNKSGMEYACIQGWGIFDGQPTSAFVAQMVARHIHIVRIPLNEDCWLNVNMGTSVYGGAVYQAALDGFVQQLNAAGIYALLDLHWGAAGATPARGQEPMPDADHTLAFWSSVAARYANQPGVLFDTFNEPHDVSWGCWLSGAGCSGLAYTAVGQQALVNAIRATGARNPVLVEGLAWANDLTGVLSHWPTDATGNLVAETHIYTFNACANATCWQTQLAPVAAAHPLFVGEFGQSGTSATASDDALATWMATQPGVSGWTAWTYNAGFNLGEAMLGSTDGSLTTWGQWVVAHLTALAGAPPPSPVPSPRPSPRPSPPPTPPTPRGKPCVELVNGMMTTGTCYGTFVPSPSR